MASKRRFTDSPGEGPNPKHCALGIEDDVTQETGNEIKLEDLEDVPHSVKKHCTNVDCIIDQVKDEPEDETTYKVDTNEPGWDIADEKPVICEIPVEVDEVDPLRPLNLNAEGKDEPIEDEMKTENDEDFCEYSGSSKINNCAAEEIKSPAAAEEKQQAACTDIMKERSVILSRKIPLQEPNPSTEIKGSESRKSPDLQNILSWVSQPSSISSRPERPHTSHVPLDRPQQVSTGGAPRFGTRGYRLQKHFPGLAPQPSAHQNTKNIRRSLGYHGEDSVSAADHRTHQSTNIEIGNVRQDSETQDLVKPRSRYTEPQFEVATRQPPPTSLTQTDLSENSGSSSIVRLLVENRLSERTQERDNSIIQAGRSTPLMGIPRNPNNGFWPTTKDYQLIPWLTGLKILQKYYCWPCLLFTKEKWTVAGGLKQPEFWAAIKNHNDSLLHKAAYTNLKLRESKLTSPKKQVPEPNLIVKANRAFLELLILILCSKKTKLHNTDSNFDGYEELMKVAISHEPELHQSFENLSEDGLIDFVSRHASKLLSCIGSKIKASIFEEISSSQYVSIIYEDTASIVDRKSKVAVIARILTKCGDVCERFVKLVKIGSSRNAYDILEIHLALIEELGIADKLVGFAFTGTVVAPKSIEEFTNMVSKNSPKAKFFHHPDHNLKELLLQSLSHLKECQRFLEVISEMVTFLTTNSGAIPTLVTFIKHNVGNCPDLEDPRNFTTDIISTIRVYYPHVIEFFAKVSEKFWNDEVAKQAPTFMKFLQEPSSRLLIALIATILEMVEDLSKAMEKDYEAVEWRSLSQKVLEKLKELHEKKANHYVFLACKMRRSDKDKVEKINAEITKSFLDTFKKVIETSLICIFFRARKSNSFYLDSAQLETPEIIDAKENWDRYGLSFDTQQAFQYQMNYNKFIQVSYNNQSIPDIAKAVSNKQISDLAEDYLKSPKFLVFQDFIRFCAVAKSPTKSTTRAPSTVLKLKYYLKDKEELDDTEVLMFLEKRILRSQMKNAEFIEEIVTTYAKENKEYNFTYNSSVPCKSEID